MNWKVMLVNFFTRRKILLQVYISLVKLNCIKQDYGILLWSFVCLSGLWIHWKTLWQTLVNGYIDSHPQHFYSDPPHHPDKTPLSDKTCCCPPWTPFILVTLNFLQRLFVFNKHYT